MSNDSKKTYEIELSHDEEGTVQIREGLRSPVIFEIIRREGEAELRRPAFSLGMSGVAAGLAMGFSVIGEAVLHAYLPDAPWRHLVESLAFAAAISVPGAVPVEVFEAAMSISHHMMENTIWEMFIRGIISGWLIASLVWMMPSADAAKFWAIILITYVIAAGSFTHIVAGSIEAFLLVLNGNLTLFAMARDFFVPVLFGNIVGGSVLFGLLSYGQISQEV